MKLLRPWASSNQKNKKDDLGLNQWYTLQSELLKKSIIPIPKKRNAKKRGPNYHTVVLISHASKVILKILQLRLQQYVNQELPDVQAGKGREIRDQIANIHWITEKARELERNIYVCSIDYAKAFDCGS